MTEQSASLAELNERSRSIFRLLVETYLETGEPVGSRTLSKQLELSLSAASVRNVMQDLEQLGLLDSPHISAGRIPTQTGLRMFVDGLLEVGDIAGDERAQIEASLGSDAGDMAGLMDQAGAMLSGLSHCASLVLAPKEEAAIRHVEFVSLAPDRALIVLVTDTGQVENRVIRPPLGLTPSAMREAANYLNAHLEGRTLDEARDVIARQESQGRRELNDLARQLVEMGLASWSGEETDEGDPERLIVRGRANLIDDQAGTEELERMRLLFDDLERKRDIAQLLELAREGEGVRIFIGSENKLFSLSGSSLVISPYMNAEKKVIGAIGVIGPTRLNYGRIVPIVDYTARLVGRAIGERGRG